MLQDIISDGEHERTFHPSPVTRKRPDWLLKLVLGFTGDDAEHVGALLFEIYGAVHGGQHRLAAMGIRAVLEQAMIAKVGDLKTFDEKLDAFQTRGYISLIQRYAMRPTLDVGDAAMHRAFKPSEQELNTALDIVEGVLAAIYAHQEAAVNMTKRVPPRKKPAKK